jgi:hypothetical protein
MDKFINYLLAVIQFIGLTSMSLFLFIFILKTFFTSMNLLAIDTNSVFGVVISLGATWFSFILTERLINWIENDKK